MVHITIVFPGFLNQLYKLTIVINTINIHKPWWNWSYVPHIPRWYASLLNRCASGTNRCALAPNWTAWNVRTSQKVVIALTEINRKPLNHTNGFGSKLGYHWPTVQWSCLVGKPSIFGVDNLSHSQIFTENIWMCGVHPEQKTVWNGENQTCLNNRSWGSVETPCLCGFKKWCSWIA